MISQELRDRAAQLLATECVHKQAWQELVTELLKASEAPADFGIPEAQEPKYTVNANGRIVNRVTGKPIPDDEPIVIFRAQDSRAVFHLEEYADDCRDDKHRDVVLKRADEFHQFSRQHPERMKEPD